MTGPIEMMAFGAAATFGPQVGAEIPQDVTYSYWPVHYPAGVPTTFTEQPFPLSGVSFTVQARGAGELAASVQCHDAEIRARDPWACFVRRRTGIVVVRTTTDRNSGVASHTAVWHGILWENPGDPSTGRMNLKFGTIESLWARRRITGPPPVGQRDANGDPLPGMRWEDADQAQIVRDLLDPTKFSQFGLVAGATGGWIHVDAPAENMGVTRTHSYRRGQETNLLTAHQDRSRVINGYEWFTAVRIDTGDGEQPETFGINYVWGYPRLGRRYGTDDVPRFSHYVDGRGNVVDIRPVATDVAKSSIMWGTGSGFDDDAVRAVAWNSIDWANDFLVTEESYSNPDVSVQETLQEQTDAALIASYANSEYLESVELRADLQPHFGSYGIGDDCLVTTDNWTLPGNTDDERATTYLSRIMGWKLTPPEAENSEKVELLIAGQEEAEGDG